MSNGTTREKQTERVIHAMTIGLCKDLFNDVIIEIITQDVREQEHPSLREMNRNRETYSIAEEVNEINALLLMLGNDDIEQLARNAPDRTTKQFFIQELYRRDNRRGVNLARELLAG